MRLLMFLTIGSLCCWGATPALAQPANDDCSTPDPLVVGPNPYDTFLATDSTQPDSGCPTGNFWGNMSNDIWWTFTATTSGVHQVDNCAFGHDSDLEVYDATGGSCDTSISVGCSGDSCGLNSSVSFSAIAGVTYSVRLGSWAAATGGSGELVLTVLGTVLGTDECIGASPIGEGTFAFDTSTSTQSSPPQSCGISAPDVWFEYTTTCTGQATIETLSGPNFDTIVEVFDVCGGTVLACNDDFGFTLLSQVQFPSVAGSSYLVRVSGWAGGVGTGSFVVSCITSGPEVCSDGLDNDLDGSTDCDDGDCAADPACALVGNDFCVGAIAVGEGSFAFDTTTATQGGPPFICGIDAPDVWFAYTSSCDGLATIEATFFTNGNDTVCHIYDACGGAQIACNDDFQTLLSFVQFPTVAGTTYLVRMSGWFGGVGNGNFDISCFNSGPEICDDTLDNDLDGLTDCADSADCSAVPACDESLNCADGIDNDIDGTIDCDDGDCSADPACAAVGNDFCLGAVPIGEGSFAFDTTAASQGGPVGCGIAAPDVWFEYTPSCNGGARIQATSFTSNNDTVCHVYDACGGALIVCNDDTFSSLLSVVDFPCTAGTTYLVRMSGWAGATGSGFFDVSCFNAGPEICNDTFDNDLDGLTDCADQVDCVSQPACNESLNCSDGLDNDLDGLTDCFDQADCGTEPQCIEAGNCQDGLDNDGDGLADCSDTIDCPTGIAPCIPPANDDCLSAEPLLCGQTVTSSTVLANPDVAPFCGTSDGSGGGVWYVFAGNGDQVTLTTCSPVSNYDTKLRVYEGSCAVPACVTGIDDSFTCPFGGLLSTVSFLSTPGIDYYILVHGFSSSEGTFELTMTCFTPGPEVCNDGFDNDLDGFLDCFDPDCALLPICQEICNDGIDNEGDGFIDCADGECACTAFCPTPIPGDECCTALPVVTGANAFSTIGMTTSSDAYDTSQCQFTAFGSNANDIWLAWTASISGDAFWDTCDAASFDTDVTIYEGSNCATKVQIACNGDGVGLGGCQIFYSSGQFPIVAGTTYLIRIGGFNPGLTGSGTLTLVETCSAAVTNLVGTADCVSGDVTLTWDPAGFANYDIARDGTVIATGLPASATTYTDTAVANGSYLYDVIGNCTGGGGATSSVPVTVATYNGEQDLVVRGELPSIVDSVAALTAELTSLGRTFVVWDGAIADYSCAAAPFEIIWQMNGTFPAYRCLTAADGAALQAAHFLGVGVYTECGDQWGFCPPGGSGAFETFDGVAFAADGGDDFTGMDGADSGLGLDLSANANIPYTQDQAGNDWTDQLTVATSEGSLSAAAQIWRKDDALGGMYTTGVYGTGIDPAGDVISQSWEFGGYGGDKNALASDYVAALGGGPSLPQFRRGDTNIDGMLNIADAIFGLGALFPPPGSPPNVLQCRDAGDANDDGAINIADMITILSVLFPAGGGGPTVLPPPFQVCGTDPTSDPEDCANYPSCP